MIHISDAIRNVIDCGSDLNGRCGTEISVLNCTRVKLNKISKIEKGDETMTLWRVVGI